MKVLVGEPVPAIADPIIERLTQEFPAIEATATVSGPADVLIVGGTMPPDQLHAVLRTALDGGIGWIHTLTTGVDHVLLPEVVDGDIVVTSSAAATATPVAEFAMARILEDAKRLPFFAQEQAAHRWSRVFVQTLERSTVTVVGLGPVGRRVAELCGAFGMHVIGVRRRPDAGAGPCAEVVGPDGLAGAMAASDYVVVAPALTPDTRHLVGRRELEAAKQGALVVNVSRGEVVDLDAVAELAAAGHIHAALDVFPTEPLPPDSPLWDNPGVSISPHVPTWTAPLITNLVDLAAANVGRYLRGEPLMHVVDKRLGYPVT